MSNVGLEVPTPNNSHIIGAGHQPQMAFGEQSTGRQAMKSNAFGLLGATRIPNIPPTITTVWSDSFPGCIYPEPLYACPGKPTFKRTSMNSWHEPPVRDAPAANGRG